MQQGIIYDIKEFTVHDGPGIRTTVFFKGCPLRCLWCHNPEGINSKRQLMITKNGCCNCGKCRKECSHAECAGLGRCIKICPDGLVKAVGNKIDAIVLAESLKKQSAFFGGSGITISGGEPTQQPEFLFELLEGLKGIHTVVETCGHTTEEIFSRLIQSCTLIYMDIKHMDSSVHKRLTGAGNESIQKNLDLLIASGREFVIRVPLIPGLNDGEENLIRIAERLAGVKDLLAVEFLPYNPFTGAKYAMAEMEFPLADIDGSRYIPKLPEERYRELGVHFLIY